MTHFENVPGDNRHAWPAAACAVGLVLVGLLSLQVSDEPWGDRHWFVATYLTGTFLLDLLLALFLILHVLAGAPTRALAWLAAGYAFAAISSAVQFLTFPGLLAQPLAAQEADNVASWIWVVWHAGFPCFVLLAVGAHLQTARPGRGRILPVPLINLFPVAVGVVAAATALTLLLLYPEQLPIMARGNDYSNLAHGPVGGALLALNLFTLGTLIARTRLRKVIYVWLAVVMFAFTLEIVLALLATVRFNGGWYIGRCVSLASASALVVSLMIEHFNLRRDAEIRAAFHEQEALHDPLTGLFNRRHLMSQLTEELGRAQRYRYPVSVLLLDLDFFKRINDQHGHPGGDCCLQALAQLLRERVHRPGEFAARYGGEEFVVVLLETGQDGAIGVAEELRLGIASLHDRGLAPCPMTASIGVATSSSSAPATPEALLSEADACLYRAKAQGRNCVVWPQRSPHLHDLKSAAPA